MIEERGRFFEIGGEGGSPDASAGCSRRRRGRLGGGLRRVGRRPPRGSIFKRGGSPFSRGGRLFAAPL